MSRFFVGQRVRVVWVEKPSGKHFIGKEAVITEPLSRRYGMDGREWLGYGVSLHPQFAPRPEQLEPIVPDGHRACHDQFKRDLDKLLEGLPA